MRDSADFDDYGVTRRGSKRGKFPGGLVLALLGDVQVGAEAAQVPGWYHDGSEGRGRRGRRAVISAGGGPGCRTPSRWVLRVIAT
jgi:hypothetical protein